MSRLTPLAAQVVRDPDPAGPRQPWRTYRLALETTPEWATHRVILQDDAYPCDNFGPLLRGAVAAQPNSLVILCLCDRPTYLAQRAQRSYAAGRAWLACDRYQWVPVIGLVWPVALVWKALRWVEAQKWPREFMADDEIVGRFAKANRERVVATVPSLVQHPDLCPSLIGKRTRSGGRVAAIFYDDPGAIDWAVGCP